MAAAGVSARIVRESLLFFPSNGRDGGCRLVEIVRVSVARQACLGVSLATRTSQGCSAEIVTCVDVIWEMVTLGDNPAGGHRWRSHRVQIASREAETAAILCPGACAALELRLYEPRRAPEVHVAE